MVRIENLTKSFGGKILFDNIGIAINKNERVGLVGRNGHGKTTLLRMICGEETPDSGSIVLPKNYRVGYVRQTLRFSQPTVLKEGMTGLAADHRDQFWKVEKILAGLGFSPEQMHMAPETFSGGFQIRLNLAKVLVSEPDLLLLDEPTNYLDIASIRWIGRFLIQWPHELLLITHDRNFMDQVVTHIIGIHRHTLRKLKGTTEKYYSQIAQDEEVYEKTRLNTERRRKEIEQFIGRFRAKARLANLVQSRIKTLSKLENKEKLVALKSLDFSFRSSPIRTKTLLRAEHISFGYPSRPELIHEFNLSVGANDRICIVGKNGKGKTTLLRLLAASIAPDRGRIDPHPKLRMGVFEQTNLQTLNPSRTVEEEILYSHSDLDRQQARNICGAMLFEGDNALKPIRVLSGGEKSRVMLGKLLATPLHLLLLDEPTNHFDMESCDALLAALDNFDGAVVMVTHNELFLHALANRLIVFQERGIRVFEGSYQEFLEKVGWEDEAGVSSGSGPEPDPEQAEAADLKFTKKDLRRKRSEIISERSLALKPLSDRIQTVEDTIETRESVLNDLTASMQSASESGDGNRIKEISKEIHRCQQEIDGLFDELELLSRRQESIQRQFDQKLQKLT